jgi:hypothetical protein
MASQRVTTVITSDEAYRHAFARAFIALEKFDLAQGHFDARRIHRVELTPAIEALLDAKLNLLRESEKEELSDRYFK